MTLVIFLVQAIVQVFTFLILVHVILSYFLSPFHPIRQFVDQLVEPFLAPIRRILPSTGMLDFSPLVLMIILQLVGSLLINILRY